MNKFVKIGLLLAVILIIAGTVVLGVMDIPAPTGTVETELDDSRFPR